MDNIDMFIADDQDGELDPNDAWLMRAAGGEDEPDENLAVAAVGAAPRDDDQFSFEDSERFEEDSLCSWMSDTESLNQNWRGWSAARTSSAHVARGDVNYADGACASSSSHHSSAHRYTGGITSVAVPSSSVLPLAHNRSRRSTTSSPSSSNHNNNNNDTTRRGMDLGLSVVRDDCSPLNAASPPSSTSKRNRDAKSIATVQSLAERAAHCAARYYSFDALEAAYHSISVERRRTAIKRDARDPEEAAFLMNSATFTDHEAIPDKFFLSIVRWCFPESEEDIRLYSCLANGNADEFGRGEYLYESDAVHDVFQIGYHLSAVVNGLISGSMSAGTLAVPTSAAVPATVKPNRQSKNIYNVSVRVDRCRIVSCSCSCAFKASWCQHVVAVCLHRIHRSHQIEYRVTIWDSINELTNNKLKKFAQFLINDLPRQYLPLAQRLIDQLRNPNSEINTAVGAPDPTDGGHEDVAIWCLDQRTLHENIRRILVKFCVPSPTVHCDVQYLSSNQPPAASEWQSLLRPHRSKDPEGLWNLLSIVREMFKRRDENATSLLHIITEECLACAQVLIWWYQTALLQSGQWFLCSPSGNKSSSLMSSQNAPQFNCASLCDEIVQLWRLAALNPRLSELEREQLASFLQIYHRNAVERIWKNICSATTDVSAQAQPNGLTASVIDHRGERLAIENARFTFDLFPGFLLALKACYVGWNGISVEGADSGTTSVLKLNQMLSVNTSSANAHVSCTGHYSPNMPVLRRHSRISEGTSLPDVPGTSGSLFRNAFYHYSVHQQGSSRSTKRRKKTSSRLNRNRMHQPFEFHDERSLERAVRNLALGEEMEEESAESGQESETGPSRPTESNQNNHSNAREKSSNNEEWNATAGMSETNNNKPSLSWSDVDELFARAHIQPSNLDIKFARCEALMSHGYTRQACDMAIELSNEMIEKPPDLLYSSSKTEFRGCHSDGNAVGSSKMGAKSRRRKSSQSSSIPTTSTQSGAAAAGESSLLSEFDEGLLESSQLAAITISRTIFLVQSLIKEPETHRLAFTLALHALQLPRGPAATKFLEVKLYHLEAELVNLLRRLEIGAYELQLIRDRARIFVMNASIFASSPHARVLPISLAHYLLDALSYSHNITSSYQGRRSSSGITTRSSAQRRPSDEELAVKVALEALGMKLMVSEADNPMLCESTRRQRGELAITMLMRYKDCTEKLAVVLDQLLDPTMHHMYKDHQSNAAYYLEQDAVHVKLYGGQRPQYPYHGQRSDWLKECLDNESVSRDANFRRQTFCEGAAASGSRRSSHTSEPCDEIANEITSSSDVLCDDPRDNERLKQQFDVTSSMINQRQESTDESSSIVSTSQQRSSDDSNDSPSDESSSSGISHGIIIDAARQTSLECQSASTETSKSPSPAHHVSGGLGGVGSSQTHPPSGSEQASTSAANRNSDSSSPYYKLNRRKPIPSSPNQASEAQAHYMMELAKRLLIEAGGSQNTVIFNASQNIAGQNNAQHNGPHRQLHICSFLIGLYALGLNNLVSTSWQTRTYSTNVSWIHGQAIEIGYTAIKIVERVWESHLTPTEVAALADKASQSRDPGMVEAAAKLALSVLPKAYALTAAESQKALHQCKEQSSEMLEKACKAVEQAAEKDGVYPEVLFKVARHWYELFCESETNAQQQPVTTANSLTNTPLQSQSPVAQFPPSITQTQSGGETLPPQLHQVFYPTNGTMLQIPQMQFTQLSLAQQLPFQQASYYRFPPQHPSATQHPSALSHRSTSLFMQPINTAQQQQQQQQQQQLIMPYGPRGPLPPPPAATSSSAVVVSGMHLNASMQLGQTSSAQQQQQQQQTSSVGMIQSGGVMNVNVPGAMSARSLHVSHSAPNLTPLQAVHISRRGGGGGTLGVSSCATAPLLPPTSFTPQHQPNQQPPITTSVQLQHPPPVGNNDHTVQMPVPSLSGAPALSTLHHHQNITTSGPSMIQNCPQLLSTPPPPCGAAISSATNAQMHHGNPLNTAPPVSHPPPNSIVTFIHHQPNITNTIAPSVSGGMIVGDPRMVKLVHAHRVGMKALETMGNRNHDDNRSYAKFSQNPAYADDVRWLFSIAVKLGGVFTQSFCEVAARSIASPFVLFSLAVESTKVFHWQMPQISYHSQALLHPIIRSQMANGSSNSKHNHAPQVRSVLMQCGFPAPTADLMQHCVEMFYMAASSKLSHPRFVASDTEEVVQLVKTARDAFYWIPGPGKLMFDDFMRHVRKQKACKKDVAQRINACIQQPS